MNSFELFEAIGELPPETVQIKEAASPRRRIVTSIAAAIAVVLALQIAVWIIEANNRPTPPGPTCGTPDGLGSADGVESDSAARLPEGEGNLPGDDTTDESTTPPDAPEENILHDFKVTENDHILSFYSEVIEECEWIGTKAYYVKSLDYDLDGDGENETISYFMSSIHSGSLGNIDINVIDGEKKIPFDSVICLNPHHDENMNYEEQRPILQILGSKTRGYYDFRYVITDRNNNIVSECVFRYDGNAYVRTDASVKVLEENAHYKLTQIGDRYICEIYDSNGTVVYSEEFTGRAPHITMIHDHLVQWIIQAGTGTATNWGWYFDRSANRRSEVFHCIYDANDGLVCHGGGSFGIIVVDDIFDEAQYHRVISDFANEFSPVAEPILSAVLSKDNTKLTVTYLTGEDYKEVTETFDLQ